MIVLKIKIASGLNYGWLATLSPMPPRGTIAEVIGHQFEVGVLPQDAIWASSSNRVLPQDAHQHPRKIERPEAGR